jgi:chaperonin cofactor prefoldin
MEDIVDIRTQPFTTDALTIKQLKEILSVLPDTNEYGEDYEVWMSVGNNLSNVVKSVWSLNLRNDGCDIILE